MFLMQIGHCTNYIAFDERCKAVDIVAIWLLGGGDAAMYEELLEDSNTRGVRRC